MAATFRRIPNPTWLGYSIGRWEGDTLVVTTAGFNDKGWLDSAGHPQTESLRITERLRRRDFGHMDFEMTIDDPKVFTRPFTVKTERLLAPDTDLLEDVCENERDRARMSGDTGIRLSPELLATYAGFMSSRRDAKIVVTVIGDLLFVQGLNEPKLPLLVQSETKFMSTATPTGFEFVKDAQGTVTHLIVRGAAGDSESGPQRPTAEVVVGGQARCLTPCLTLARRAQTRKARCPRQPQRIACRRPRRSSGRSPSGRRGSLSTAARRCARRARGSGLRGFP